ncbi:MAG: hydrogenase maturation nickel metallochaperone HypA [Clostridia bacterium]|nr:hydrogenase maturation nickel metallochaperone HypA [Clostridia bacterium]
MHELGIVMHVVKSVEDVAKQNSVQKVVKLRMEVGEVSSVVPELFEDCFAWAKKRTEFLTDCELELIIIQGISYCKDCQNTYPTTEYAKKCPHCGSINTYLVTGNEINIKDIEAI